VRKQRAQSIERAGLSRRTRFVWLSFLASMTLVTGLLVPGEGGLSGGRLIAATVGTVGGRAPADSILPRDVPLDRRRWEGIVIHHLGRPAGDAQSIHRLHQSYGYQGLGYHFLIGNGCGLGDGIIHVGYRWNEQQPGAHIARTAEHEQYLNEHTIGICLIGNGDRRPFTDKQMRSLVSLVRRLQHDLDIPRSRVYQHCELAPGVSDPGRFFAVARFEDQLLD
jgi:hypothetical protein